MEYVCMRCVCGQESCMHAMTVANYRCHTRSLFFFFKQKTAYEMRISDWSSDVCSSDLRSTLGAIQNRFESTISNLQAVSQNLSASRSRIQDTDFAAETAALSRAQILQTAGITVLSQANSSPQAVLQLLR